MRIAVVGTGAMGSVHAALLASAGHELWAVDTWREHVDAIQARGLRVEGASGDRNATFSGPCAVLDCTIGELIADPPAWMVAARCAQEAFDVASALGVALSFDESGSYVRQYGLKISGARPSTLPDLTAGRRCEIDFINGGVARTGRRIGVATPFNEAITAFVKSREAKALRP